MQVHTNVPLEHLTALRRGRPGANTSSVIREALAALNESWDGREDYPVGFDLLCGRLCTLPLHGAHPDYPDSLRKGEQERVHFAARRERDQALLTLAASRTGSTSDAVRVAVAHLADLLVVAEGVSP